MLCTHLSGVRIPSSPPIFHSMKLDTQYFAIKKPDGTTVTNINSENGGLFTTENKAQSYLNKLIANAKNRLKSSQKRLDENPLNGVENANFKGWEARLNELSTCKVVPVKVIGC